MFKVLDKNKIVGLVEKWTDDDREMHPNLIIKEDLEHKFSDYIMVDDEYILNTDDKVIELKKEEIKKIRNSMLENVEWRVLRAKEQRELGIKTVDNYYHLIHYKQYLRDYPDEVENWWEQNPLEFEEWEEQYEYKQES